VRSFPPDLPATAWLTLADVLQFVPLSRSAWFRGVASGQLPRPFKVGQKAFWTARDIRRLLDNGPRRALKRRAVKAPPGPRISEKIERARTKARYFHGIAIVAE
jgi:prophage regulatory protein